MGLLSSVRRDIQAALERDPAARSTLEGVLTYHGFPAPRRAKRPPTRVSNVVVGAGAKIIGAVNVGDNTRIGAGAVVVTNVPPNATVVGVPGHIVAYHEPTDDTILRLPDPEWDRLQELENRIQKLEGGLQALEERLGASVDREGPQAREGRA